MISVILFPKLYVIVKNRLRRKIHGNIQPLKQKIVEIQQYAETTNSVIPILTKLEEKLEKTNKYVVKFQISSTTESWASEYTDNIGYWDKVNISFKVISKETIKKEEENDEILLKSIKEDLNKMPWTKERRLKTIEYLKKYPQFNHCGTTSLSLYLLSPVQYYIQFNAK